MSQGKNNIQEICFRFWKEIVFSNFFYRLEYPISSVQKKMHIMFRISVTSQNYTA